MSLIEKLTLWSGPFVIYGAQVVAYGAYCAILHLCGRKPECFVVSSLDNNPVGINYIPVRELSWIPADTLVIVAVTELLQGEVAANLEAHGFRNSFFLTQHEEHLLMSEYFASIGKFPVIHSSGRDADKSGLAMFMVKNHRDKPLYHPPATCTYEIIIQAGAALTRERIADHTDNTGENISAKNQQYCEMSATYWVWKNTNYPWTGIEHYRRRLLVKPEMLGSEADAILPLPYICYPNAATQFRRFVSEDVLQAMLRALQELHPDEYADYQEILYGSYQYTYNLLCAKRHVFEDYCTWFFAITEHMETMADAVPEIKNTRALSYVAEALTNIYFMHNKNHWNIVHTEKGIYI